MDDNQIIELFFERSERAVAELSGKYGRLCNAVSYNILQSREDAEECVNDAYFTIWNKIPPERPSSLAAFVCMIVRNVSLNRFKYNKAQKRGYAVCLDELEECVSGADSPEERFETKELAGYIDEFLDTLDDKSHAVFVRRYWFGDNFSRIGELIGASEGAVKVRLTRLRKKLRDFLSAKGVTL
ncbi:MAG: sigma-70 family RNA polymerase sigma factor [Lachnospiraceae bacterium]|nr:sigma-70 family RNA polymerase sigma factor [Ruminococcus sp.]MCM1275373.1 sigma-70 family RNA polymerase sigma factor [Lachnospiraceae bacterium]